MSYLDRYELGTNNLGFRNRCLMALLDVAVAVVQEDPATYGHAQRAGMASAIMADAVNSANAMAITAAASGVLTDASTDQEIHDELQSQWNTFAGVSPEPV